MAGCQAGRYWSQGVQKKMVLYKLNGNAKMLADSDSSSKSPYSSFLHLQQAWLIYTGRREADLTALGLDDGPKLTEEVDADPDGEQDLQHQSHIVPAGLIQLHTYCVDAVGHLHATNTLTLVWHNVAGKSSRQISLLQCCHPVVHSGQWSSGLLQF